MPLVLLPLDLQPQTPAVPAWLDPCKGSHPQRKQQIWAWLPGCRCYSMQQGYGCVLAGKSGPWSHRKSRREALVGEEKQLRGGDQRTSWGKCGHKLHGVLLEATWPGQSPRIALNPTCKAAVYSTRNKPFAHAPRLPENTSLQHPSPCPSSFASKIKLGPLSC